MESNSRRVQQQQPDDLTNIEFESSEDVKVIPTFESMGLRDDLLRGIYAYGFEKPSTIQQRAIPYHQGPRCYCSGPIGYRKNGNIFYINPSEHRYPN